MPPGPVSMESTMRAKPGVGMPVESLGLGRDALALDVDHRIGASGET